MFEVIDRPIYNELILLYSMDCVFEVIDKSERRIKLTNKQWKHIQSDHPDVDDEEIKQTLQEPVKIFGGKKKKYFYHRYFKDHQSPAKFLRVIVKYLNGGGICDNSIFC